MNNPDFDYAQSVFLDETALMAFMNSDHVHYTKARTLFYDLDDLDRKLVTTNHVIFDTHQRLRNHFGYTHAEYFIRIMDKAGALGKLDIISGNPQLEQEAKLLLEERPEYEFSLTEAFTAMVVITWRIKRVFTFNPKYDLLRNLDSEIKVIPSVW